MKTKQVLALIVFILFTMGWYAPIWAQEIPTNYIQNPNMEHELNAIFWYGGWDPIYGSDGIAHYPDAYLSNKDSHSGDWCLSLFRDCYIWVSYPIRGHEEKTFKASFWYKGYMTGYWNFIYRDVGMTEDDLPPELAEYIGADTCYHEMGGQNALRFVMGGDDGLTEDWTYFEFVWDFPGTLPGWGNTSMWYAPNEPAYVDDLYYGENYDARYMGEEPLGIINGDFEKTEVNGEWLFNLASWDPWNANDFLSWTEYHTGLQSLGLMDYKVVSNKGDTSSQNRNITYYLPVLGAGGKNMELSFWYKGNAAKLKIDFYRDYGVTTSEFPEPAGANLVKDSLWTIDLQPTTLLDTFTTIHPVFTVDSGSYTVDTIDGEWKDILFQDWEGQAAVDNPKPFPATGSYWANEYTGGWATIINGGESYSGYSAVWIPLNAWIYGDSPALVVDTTRQRITFMYKDTLEFWLNFDSAWYDVRVDPDNIVPPEATATSKNEIWWSLASDEWTEFSFEWDQGTWLADSGITQPATFNMVLGSYGKAGYLDDFRYQRWITVDPERIDTVYAETMELDTTEYEFYRLYVDTIAKYWDVWESPIWDLPAVADWTEWKLNWTNPSGDIGGNLTMFLDNEMTATPDYITPDKPDFDPENSGWTFFDDFVYGEVVGINNKSAMQNDLHVYPNPAVDQLYLSLEIPIRKIEVYNSTGQKVKVLLNPDRKINVSDLATGMYLLHVYDEQGGIHVSKFIK